MTKLSCNRIQNDHNLSHVTSEYRHILFAISSCTAAPAIDIGNILNDDVICNTNTFYKSIFNLNSKLINLL